MDKTQKRWSFIVNIIYLSIFVGVFYLFMKYAFWMLSPFLFALVLAGLLQKPLNFLTKNKKAPRGIISTLLVLIVVAIIAGLLALLGIKIVGSIKDLISYFTARCSNMVEFFDVLKTTYLNFDIAKRLPAEANDAITSGIDTLSSYFANGSIITKITDNISKIATPLGSVISTVPSFLTGLLFFIVSSCFMTVEFKKIKAFILRQFKGEKKDNVIRTKHILVSSVGKMVRAYALIILITATELTIGLSILKLVRIYDGSHIILISILIALIDIVPVLGTGTVMIPWSLFNFVTGNISLGIGLLVIYVIVSIIRQVIEPKLVAGQVGISPVVTIISMYIGIKLFGAIGIFILPFIVIIIKLLNDEGIIHLFVPNPEDIKDNENEKNVDDIAAFEGLEKKPEDIGNGENKG